MLFYHCRIHEVIHSLLPSIYHGVIVGVELDLGKEEFDLRKEEFVTCWRAELALLRYTYHDRDIIRSRLSHLYVPLSNGLLEGG